MYEISRLLNTGLDRETLAILVGLCENGVNPEALAAVVRDIRREAASVVSFAVNVCPRASCCSHRCNTIEPDPTLRLGTAPATSALFHLHLAG